MIRGRYLEAAGEEARRQFPRSILPYLEPVAPLYDTDFCWKYTGPHSSPEELSTSTVFSGEYFRLDDDFFELNPGYGHHMPEDKKKNYWGGYTSGAGVVYASR